MPNQTTAPLSLDLLERADLAALMPDLVARSEAGSAAASYLLGVMHEIGTGIKRDLGTTAIYHCRAIEQDVDALVRLEETPPADARMTARPGSEAMFRMSRLAMAIGDEASFDNALACFTRLAAWGDDRALAHLALMTLWGMGVPPNNEEGLRLLRLAAQQGATVAMDEMGWLEIQGELVPKNVASGIARLKAAAEAGYGQAQCRYGLLLVEGRVLPGDLDAGCDWLAQAAEQGYAAAFHPVGRLLAEHGEDDESFAEGICYLMLAADSEIAEAKADLDSALKLADAAVRREAEKRRAAWHMRPTLESNQLVPFSAD